MKAILSALIISLTLLLTGCDTVLQYPEDPVPPQPAKELTLHLEFDTEWRLLQEINYENGIARSGDAQSGRLRRYILRIYPSGRGSDSRVHINEWIFYREATLNPDATFSLQMPDGDYRILVWSDIVPDNSGSELFYAATDFDNIGFVHEQRNYKARDEAREAFRGDDNVNIDAGADTVRMEPPLAKFRFITDDLQKFLQKESKSRIDDGAVLSTKGNEPGSIDLESYKVRITYPRFMPNSFNMFTNRPADSWIGVYYDTDMRPIDQSSAEINFDHVFVNTHDTSINVRVEVYDRASGIVVARIPDIDVPLRRSHVTVVRGPFLTTHAEGGAGINPDFNGDFNIEIF